MQIVDIFRAKIIDISDKTFTIEVTGSVDKVDAMEKLLMAHGIQRAGPHRPHRHDARSTNTVSKA